MRVLRALVLTSVAATDLPLLAAADILVDGSEFQINTFTTICDRRSLDTSGSTVNGSAEAGINVPAR